MKKFGGKSREAQIGGELRVRERGLFHLSKDKGQAMVRTV